LKINKNYVIHLFNNQNPAKTKSRSPRGFPPRPCLRAGESITPPPFSQTFCGGVHLHCVPRFLLWRNCVSHRRA